MAGPAPPPTRGGGRLNRVSRALALHPDRSPLRNHPQLQVDDGTIHGPLPFLNPTQAAFRHRDRKADQRSDGSDGSATPPHGGHDELQHVRLKWTSRNNRKGRHALVVPATPPAASTVVLPPRTSTASQVRGGIWRMCARYPVWDVSYLVAVIFTWGSVVWVINAFFAFLPFTDPSTAFDGEALYGGGITAFIGATIFEIGSVLLMCEAVNENRTGCFGWALEQLWEGEAALAEDGGRPTARLAPKACSHHHKNRDNLVGKASPSESEGSQLPDGTPPGRKSWVWWPSWHELQTHYLYELGFLACSFQMFGATVFWISGFTALPGIFNHLSPRLVDGVFWVPQIIGGSGFIVSGLLFMLETQLSWWRPAVDVLGWHIGLWNLVGGIGFTLCPCFGLGSAHWAQYQASCSTFWGSWAFLVGSGIQWYESLDKYPVETRRDHRARVGEHSGPVSSDHEGEYGTIR